MKLFLLLLLPTWTLATVDVLFSGKIDFDRNQVTGFFDATKDANFEGTRLRNKENMLKDMIKAHNGQQPDEVYLTSPEDQSNLYQENGLKEVKKTTVPLNVEVKKMGTSQKLITKQPYDNYGDEPKKMVIDVHKMIQHRVQSAWDNADHIFGDKLHLNLKFRVSCGKAEIDDVFDWGHEKVVLINDELQDKQEVLIGPGEEVIGEMHAKLGYVQFAIDYNVSVTGDVVAVYNDMYKGKKYHFFNIADLIAAKGRQSTQIGKQEMTYKFYYSAFLKIVESETASSYNNNKKLSGRPIVDTEDRDETPMPKLGLGKIKMALTGKVDLEEIWKDMDTDLNKIENSAEKASEESLEN